MQSLTVIEFHLCSVDKERDHYMPLTRGDIEYVNGEEAMQLLDIGSYSTWQKAIEDFKLESKSFLGKGRSRFFPKWQVELIRDNPDEAKRRAARGWREGV